MIALPIAAEELSLASLRKYDREEKARGVNLSPHKFLCSDKQAQAAENLPYFLRPMNLSPGDFLNDLLASGNLIGCVENFAFYRKQK